MHCYRVDVSDEESIREGIARTAKQVGEVDILVNNAGTLSGKEVWDPDTRSAIHTLRVNCLGPLCLIKILLPSMRNRGRGHIINIASLMGLDNLFLSSPSD